MPIIFLGSHSAMCAAVLAGSGESLQASASSMNNAVMEVVTWRQNVRRTNDLARLPPMPATLRQVSSRFGSRLVSPFHDFMFIIFSYLDNIYI